MYKQTFTSTTTSSATSPTAAQLLLQQLAAWKVQHMYGVAGDAIVSLLDALAQQSSIRYIETRFETAAAFMASTEGKSTNRIGVCLGTSGPGLTNMLNGIADAAGDQVPLLVITGQVSQDKIGTNAKQYVQQQQMISPLAVYSAEVSHPDSVTDIVHQALVQAIHKKGVAHVSIPKDILAKISQGTVHSPLELYKQTFKQNIVHLDPAVTLLMEAKKPMIIIGEGARHCSAEIKQLSSLVQGGIIETLGAKGTIPTDYPYYVGGLGQGGTLESKELFQQADCIVAVGANWWPEGFVPTQTQVIQIDNNEAHIESHSQLTYGLVGDAQQILNMLLQRIQDRQHIQPLDKSEWHKQVQKKIKSIRTSLEKERNETAPHVTPTMLMTALDQTVNPDAIMVLDTGDHTVWFNRNFQSQKQDVLYSGKWRTMGYALPAAIAAQLCYPDRQVVAIIGDGSLAMTMMEWATAVRYQLPVKVVIMNNHSLAMETHKMQSEGYDPFGTSLYNPDFALLAQSFGVQGVRVDKPSELPGTLTTYLRSPQPVCIDVQTEATPLPLTAQDERT